MRMLILLIMSSFHNTNCYKIVSVQHATEYLGSRGIKFENYDEILNSNMAYIYILKNKEVIMLPNDIQPDSKAIIFNSNMCFTKYLHSDFFPVKNRDARTIEKYQEYIKDIRRDELVKLLINKIGIEDPPTNFDIQSIAYLIDELKKNKATLSEKEKLLSTLLLGEFLIEKYNGCWLILKKYGQFNPYYEPAIQYENGKILLLLDFAISFWDTTQLNVKNYSELPHVKNPTLELESEFFSNNFHGYKYL